MGEVREVRLYRPGDEEGITRLFGEIFERQMALEEWKWKYAGRGMGKVYSSVGVDETGRIVAHYGGMIQNMMFGSRNVRGLAIGDVMIHAKHRSFKLFRRIAEIVPAEAVKDGIILGYGFPNERALQLPVKLGLYEKIEDVFEAEKDAVFHGGIGRYVYRLFPLGYQDVRIGRLWQSVQGRTDKLAVIRNGEYLDWRYRRHPLYSYQLWGLKRRWSSRLIGLAVTRTRDDNVLLMDYVCAASVMGALLEKIENYVYTSGGKKLVCWIPGYMESVMSQKGYKVRPAGTAIPRTTHDGTLSKAEIEGKFFYTMGDTDFM